MNNNLVQWICTLRQKTFRRLFFSGLRINYYGVCDWFLFSLFVMPSYFGLRVFFFDLTAVRFFEILLILLIIKKQSRRQIFGEMIKKCPHTLWIGIYFFIVVYTNLIHPSISTIFYWLMNGVAVFYLVTYLILYEYGTYNFLYKIRVYTYFLTIISPLELVIHKSPFVILDTLGKANIASRFGNVRIVGRCGTPNSYAMYLCILLPFACFNLYKKRIDIVSNIVLVFLVAVNILLTGSRLSVGIMILIMFFCFFNQKKSELSRCTLITFLIIPCLLLIVVILKETSFVNSILCTFFSAFDEVFNTSYALKYGADSSVLYNSTYYRELLYKNTFFGGWLNPLLGRGGGYPFQMYIEGYRIASIDNFYVGQYIVYAYPGLISWFIMSASFFSLSFEKWFKTKDGIYGVVMISIIGYFISLWYLDHLQTFPIMFAVFGLIYANSKINDVKSN